MYDLDLNSRFEFAYSNVLRHYEIKRESLKVFDIGSGGALLQEKIQALGLDYSSYDLYPKTDKTRKWNIEEKFPYGIKADIIILLEVIEHINNPLLALKNIEEVLNPGGLIIISTPNPSWSGSRISLLRSGYLDMFKPEDLKLNHHVFIAWPHILEYMMQQAQFKSITLHPLGKKTSLWAYPFWSLKLPFRLLYRSVKKMIEAKDRSSIGALYGVLAYKAN